MKLSRQDIHQTASHIQTQYETLIGNCREVSLDIQQELKSEFGVPSEVRELQVGDKRETHFALILQPEYFAESTDQPVIIDATIAQFASENQSHSKVRQDFGPKDYLPTVGIYTAGDEERIHWYHKPNQPDPYADPL